MRNLSVMKKPLSAWETMKRRDAVAQANASLYLEGFTPSAAAVARAEQFIAGEINVEDLGPTPKQTPMEELMDYFQSPKFSKDFQATIANDRLKEQAFRQKIVERVNASNALEGYTPDEHLTELQRRYIALEINTSEMLESCREFAEKVVKLLPPAPPSMTEENI